MILGTVVSNPLTANEDSSSSSSEDDDIQVRAVFVNAFVSLVSEVHSRQVGYIQVISQYSCQEFWRHFRVSRAPHLDYFCIICKLITFAQKLHIMVALNQ